MIKPKVKGELIFCLYALSAVCRELSCTGKTRCGIVINPCAVFDSQIMDNLEGVFISQIFPKQAAISSDPAHALNHEGFSCGGQGAMGGAEGLFANMCASSFPEGSQFCFL